MNGGWPGEQLEHEQIVAWVQAHPEALSASLATISTYPIAFRKVIVNAMPDHRRLALWREHLENVAAGPELSAAQKAVILETAAELPAIFASESTERDWQRQVAEHFTSTQQHTLFGTLGPPEPPGGLPLPDGLRPMAPG